MVRARLLTPDGVIEAMKRGDFYASSGVTLRDVKYDAGDEDDRARDRADGDATFTTQFVGTPKSVRAQNGGARRWIRRRWARRSPRWRA